MITVELTDEEVKLFIVLRKAGFFELQDNADIIIHKKNGVITDIKKYIGKQKDMFEMIYQRKKTSLDNLVG